MAKANVQNVIGSATWFYGKDAIEAAIGKMQKAGEKFQDELHRCACSALKHVIEHKDPVYVQRFIDAMPESSRKNAFKLWFETFGPVSFADKLHYVKGGNIALAAAVTMPAWKLKPEQDYKPMDVSGAIDGLIQKIKADAKKTGRDFTGIMSALTEVKAKVPVVQVIDVAKAA